MLRRLLAILATFFFLVPATPVFADDPTFKDLAGPLTEFCEKRTGDVANLETWYSGKCKTDGDTLTGDGVGFADIVILDFAERVLGPQSNGNSSIDMLMKLIEQVGKITADNSLNDDQKELALLNAKVKIINEKQPLLGFIGSSISMIALNPPASTNQYLSYVQNNLAQHQIVKPALAQSEGYGFQTMTPFAALWKAFRNVAYTLFVVVFIVYGFMIMFRFKISPQTVITFESAIPNLIGILLVITFSFAIVGIVWDISTFTFFAFYNLLRANGVVVNTGFLGITFPEFASGRFGGLMVSFAINMILAVIISPFAIIGTLLGGNEFISSIMSGAIGLGMLFTGIGLIIALIIMIGIFISYFKLFKSLLSSFIDLVIGLIFAPIELLQGIMPGSKVVENWMMRMFANAMVFPVASGLLMLSYIFMVQTIYGFAGWLGGPIEVLFGVNNFVSWIPGTLGGLNIPLISFFGATPSAIMGIIGLGLLFMASKYTDLVKEALKVPPSKYGSAVAEAINEGGRQVHDPNSTARKYVPGIDGAVRAGDALGRHTLGTPATDVTKAALGHK